MMLDTMKKWWEPCLSIVLHRYYTYLVVWRLTFAISPRLTMMVLGRGSTGMKWPDLSITSRPQTPSSIWTIYMKPESVCVSIPVNPTLWGVKWYLFILNWNIQFSNPIFSVFTPKPSTIFSAILIRSSCTAPTYLVIISLFQKEK